MCSLQYVQELVIVQNWRILWWAHRRNSKGRNTCSNKWFLGLHWMWSYFPTVLGLYNSKSFIGGDWIRTPYIWPRSLTFHTGSKAQQICLDLLIT